MKIAVITLHHITNFGSMLQSYATQRQLEKMGHRVEIVDFVPVGTTLKKAIFPPSNRPLRSKLLRFVPLVVCNTTQSLIMHRFNAHNLHLTKRRFSTYTELAADCPQADVYISGSDQIWNTQNANLPEDVKAYYLCFVPDDKKKIAYASSFGKTEFSAQERTEITAWLSRYQAVSVREDTAVDTLRLLGIENGQQVLDPTLLLSAQEWQTFIQKKAPTPGYLFVYNLNRNPLMAKLAVKIAKEKHLRIVNFADTYSFIRGAENRVINTAYDFVNYIAGADFVVTDSFHGTAFSVNFGRQFLCVPPPKYSCRLESLLRLLKLSSRMVTDEAEGMRRAAELVSVENVQRILEEQRILSNSFLTDALRELQ